MAHSSMAIANAFLEQPGALGDLTQMQLQKLAYIAHGWNLAVSGEPLIGDSVHAWLHGPVFPQLYEHVRYFGAKPLPRLITDLDVDRFSFFSGEAEERGKPYKAKLSGREREVLDRVWKRYGPYNAFNLSRITHQPETPWFKTYAKYGRSARIPNELIREHYVELGRAAAA